MRFGPFCIALETSPGRYSSLSRCVAELSAHVHPNVFWGDTLSLVSLQCRRLSVGRMAMSGPVKQFKEKYCPVKTPKCEVILFGNMLGILQVEIPYCFVVLSFHLTA